jgi:3'-5' exoribonuclease
MSRRYISQLGEREVVNDVFLASEKQLRPNRNGNLYLQMRLSDRTGSLNAMMWNASDRSGQEIGNGDFVRVEGTTQLYNGNLQVIISRLEQAEPGEVNEDELRRIDRAKTERLMARMSALLRQIEDFHLRNLAECLLLDESLLQKLRLAPAGIKNHHAYPGGLLEHVVQLMELSVLIAPRYETLDGDLLLVGAALHDIGKVDELTFDRHYGYTDEGQLIGHLVLGIRIVDDLIRRAAELAGEPFPEETAWRLKHMIISHHGEPEFGSPKPPMTIEAIALRNLDDLDAKINGFTQLMREDANIDSPWTTYQPNLGRKLFKGLHPEQFRDQGGKGGGGKQPRG